MISIMKDIEEANQAVVKSVDQVMYGLSFFRGTVLRPFSEP